MKELSWKGAILVALILVALWGINSNTPEWAKFACKANNDCSVSPDRSGCILVEGYCGTELCRVPACLNDRNIDWVRHGGST